MINHQLQTLRVSCLILQTSITPIQCTSSHFTLIKQKKIARFQHHANTEPPTMDTASVSYPLSVDPI